jgi:hypothetical protein
LPETTVTNERNVIDPPNRKWQPFNPYRPSSADDRITDCTGPDNML